MEVTENKRTQGSKGPLKGKEPDDRGHNDPSMEPSILRSMAWMSWVLTEFFGLTLLLVFVAVWLRRSFGVPEILALLLGILGLCLGLWRLIFRVRNWSKDQK